MKSRPEQAGIPPTAPRDHETSAAPPVVDEELALVEAARQGDLVAFGQLYRRHFYQIYDFAVRVTRDVRRAEEITGETLARAVDELTVPTEPPPLSGSLLAIAHGLATEPDVSGSPQGVPSVARIGRPTDEVESLIWDSVGLLGPRTYSIIDLAVRQGLTPNEVGVAAGIRDDIAAETVARTRQRAEDAISIFVLVKTRVADCSGLRGVVGAHAKGSLGNDLADIVISHLQECDGCADAWTRMPSPLDVLRRLPVVPPPPGLRDRIWARVRRRYRWSGPGSSIRRMRAATVAACVALVVGSVAIVNLGAGEADGAVAAAPAPDVVREDFIPLTPSPVAATATPMATTTTALVEIAPLPDDPTTTTVVPSEPPVVQIITPVMGQRFTSTSGLGVVELVAVAQDDVDQGLPVTWSNGATSLATGNRVTVPLVSGCPEPRTYTITATVTDSSGGSTTATVTFSVVCAGSDG